MSRYLFVGLLLATAAQAQITPTSPARQRAAERQALREAQHTQAPYKDSHLAVTRQQMRRGGSNPRTRPADEPRFLGLRRRAKNEPRP